MDLKEEMVELVTKFFNKHPKLTVVLGFILLIIDLTALFE